MNPLRGEVVLVLFPNSDLRTAKRRPALVIQRDGLQSGLPQAVVAMISSNLGRRGHPSRVFVGKAAGLKLESVVMTDNLATVFETEMVCRLGQMPKMDEIDAALRHTLALGSP
jgi:mRNA interferase MazF